MDDLWDAIVVGLGPAGSSAAALMAERGLRVLAVERAPERRKACGGFLTEKSAACLPRGWRTLVGATVHHVELAAGELLVSRHSEAPVGYLVDRKSLDGFLRNRAGERGAETLTGLVAGISHEGGVMKVHTHREVHAARYVVGAGGASCPCARFVDGARRAPKVVGMAAEMDLPPGFGPGGIRLILGLTGYGYGWLFPREHTLNLGLTERRRHARKLHPAFARFMDSGASPSSLRWLKARSIPCYDGPRRLHRNGTALAGDAAGLVDPLSGEGIFYALKSGTRAGAAVVESLGGSSGSLRRYETWVKRNLISELRAAGLLARVIFRMPHRFIGLMKARPELMDRYIEVLGGRRSYRGFSGDVLRAAGALLAGRFSRHAARDHEARP